MSFYKISEIEKRDVSNMVEGGFMQSVSGEFMKVGMVTYPEGFGPPAHFHPNEEQYILIMEGKVHMVLGDEERIVGKGDLIHIPRNENHAIRIIEGPAVFFTAKSPAGDGDLNQDYNRAKNADDIREQLSTDGA